MNHNELTALRAQILNDIVPLVIENEDNGSEKFSLLLRVIQSGNGTKELYARAYESAKKIPDTNERLNALLALMDEINLDVNQLESSEEPVANAPQETPTQTTPEQPPAQ